ncbi:sulfotransferase 1A1-like [Babylonia areolata]|uniref:sulfotransferase 1A1-like n=1 Tax=Babylonia areolata TaxID=304850 RepID=UPI003FD4473F
MSGGRCQIQDRHGNQIFFANGGDVWLSPSPQIQDYRVHLSQLRHLELRQDDVILASFPRSGTHWHFQAIGMLMNGRADYMGSFMSHHTDWIPTESLPPPDTSRLLVSHLRPRFLPQQVKEKKVKVIYCYRNPKDTWVSLYSFANIFKGIPPFEGTWDHFLDLMLEVGFWYGDWFDHVLDWEKEASAYPDQIFLSSFEDMKMDSVGQIMKIDQFLGLNRGRELCEQIAQACEFSKLKAVTYDQMPQAIKDQAWKNGVPGVFRKGEIGEWRNWFTAEQSERFDAIFEQRMKDSRLPFSFV